MYRAAIFISYIVINSQMFIAMHSSIASQSCHDFNGIDSDGRTALIRAVQAQDEPRIEALLACAVDASIQDKHGKSAFDYAHSYALKTKLAPFTFAGLIWAIEFCELSIIEEYIASNYINAQDSSGCTLLHYALEHYQNSITQLLLEKKAAYMLPNKHGRSPFMVAVEQLEACVDCPGIQVIKKYIKDGHNMNIPVNDHEQTLLIYAAIYNVEDLVKILMEHGVHKEQSDIYGKTALSYACEFGHYNIISWLLVHASRNLVNHADNEGFTPLLLIVTNKELTQDKLMAIMRDLFAYGARVNYRQKKDKAALHYACQAYHYALVELLLFYEADSNIQDKFGNTPLIYAARANSVAVVKLLLKYGADPHIKNIENKIAYDYAQVKSVASLLSKYLRPKEIFGNMDHDCAIS